MKKEIRDGLIVTGIMALFTGIMVKMVKAAPKEYEVLPAVWETSMPFPPDSEQYYFTGVKNLSDQDYIYRFEIYFNGFLTFYKESHVAPYGSIEGGGNIYMPHEPGTYPLTLKLWIDGAYISEFTISEVEVG